MREMFSLINHNEPNSSNWLNTQGFTSVQTYYYWSSTTYAGSTGYAYNVYLGDGAVGSGPKDSSYYSVWPVRGGQ